MHYTWQRHHSGLHFELYAYSSVGCAAALACQFKQSAFYHPAASRPGPLGAALLDELTVPLTTQRGTWSIVWQSSG